MRRVRIEVSRLRELIRLRRDGSSAREWRGCSTWARTPSGATAACWSRPGCSLALTTSFLFSARSRRPCTRCSRRCRRRPRRSTRGGHGSRPCLTSQRTNRPSARGRAGRTSRSPGRSWRRPGRPGADPGGDQQRRRHRATRRDSPRGRRLAAMSARHRLRRHAQVTRQALAGKASQGRDAGSTGSVGPVVALPWARGVAHDRAQQSREVHRHEPAPHPRRGETGSLRETRSTW